MRKLASSIAILSTWYASGAEPPVWKLPPGEVPQQTVSAAELDGETKGWGIDNLNIPDAWKRTRGKGIVIGVLDTGCAKNHRDLKNQIISMEDFTGSASGADDRNGHGTHCAGTIVAEDNGWGMVGAAPDAKVRIYKVLNDQGSGRVDQIARAIRKAVDDGCDIISMSLGGPQADQWIPPALAYAKSKGVIVVAASGNEGPNEGTIGYPGAYADVIAVAAHDQNDRIADFSSRGRNVFCSGPGVSVRAPYPGAGDGRFATLSGTSMACPQIAALIAMWVSANQNIPKLDRPTRVVTALRAACPRPNNRTTASGFGKPDAVKFVGTVAPQPPEPKDPVTVTLSELSLTDAERAKLKALGIDRFTLNVILGPRATMVPEMKKADLPSPESPSMPPIGNAPGPDFEWKYLPRVGYGWVQKSVR